MFTGIVEGRGRVVALDHGAGGARLRVSAPVVHDDLVTGASVAVDGCCTTVVGLDGDGFTVDLVAETLARTTLGALSPGDAVNVERPLRPVDRLGGHLVQGHVDGVAVVTGHEELPDGSRWLELSLGRDLARYVVEKGSVAVAGVSLTVAALLEDGFAVALIPHTAAATTLGGARPGTRCNVEVDALARHVERLLAFARAEA